MNNKLTVLIPTYNRKDDLLETLKALSTQSNKNFDVFISDNHSDYSIEKELLPLLPEEFVSRIQIYHQPFNIGGSANTTGLLAMCKSEWGWILSDDDYVQHNAVDNIYSAFEKYPNAKAFWFTITKELQENIVLNTMEQFQEFLVKIRKQTETIQGDFWFCSNKVYKISALTGMDNVFNFIYSAISFSFSLVELLKIKEEVVVMGVNDALIVYGGVLKYNLCPIATGMRTLIDYPTGLSWKRHCLFVRSITIYPLSLVIHCIKLEELPWNYRAYLKNIYTNCYRFTYPLHKRIMLKPLFWLASYNLTWKILKYSLPHLSAFKSKIKEKHPSMFHLLRAIKQKIL